MSGVYQTRNPGIRRWPACSMRSIIICRALFQSLMEESLRIMADINNYWAGKTELDSVIRMIPPDEAVKCFSGTVMWGIPIASASYHTRDWDYIMGKGFKGIYDEIQ